MELSVYATFKRQQETTPLDSRWEEKERQNKRDLALNHQVRERERQRREKRRAREIDRQSEREKETEEKM